MKRIFTSIFGSIAGILIFISCKKDPATPASPNPVNPGAPSNKSPVADAGPDVTVNYDLQTCTIDQVNLDGRGSTDADGPIMYYRWSGRAVISNADAAQATVRPLSTGQHQFILTVIDDKGGRDSDTMNVTVKSLMNRPAVDAQLIPFASLSKARDGIVAGRAGNKILFAGGYSSLGESSRVDIYDLNTQNWTTADLSLARQSIAVVSSGNKIFFAGGWNGDWWGFPEMFTNVDIYDATTNSWSLKHLSEARIGIGAASVGNKVLFAGGTNNDNFLHSSSKIDIYDAQTNSWTTSSLSVARSGLSAQTIGDKIYFAGGSFGTYDVPVNTIDIYDNNTGLWSASAMNEPKANMISFATGNKLIWAGGSSISPPIGTYKSGLVEIKDVGTQSSSISCLCEPQSWYGNAVVKNNQVVFFQVYGSQNKFDIYDTTTDSWRIGFLNKNIWGAALISVDNIIYVAGGVIDGSLSNMVWKLEF